MTAANTAAASQAAIAQEQWDTTKAYLPKAMALADQENARAQKAADLAESDSAFYRTAAQHQMDEAAKAEPFQQQVRDTATAYSNGNVGNAEAGRAAADVQQAYTGAMGAMTRSAGRMGLNPGSGAFAASMGDLYQQQALDAAGAQTSARAAARAKAEALVAQAAGMGQTAYANSVSTGGMASGLGASGVGTSGMGLSAMGGVQGTYTAGMGSAGAGFGNAASGLRANAIESAKTPGFDFVAGLATGGLKAFGSYAGTAEGAKTIASWSDRRLKTNIRRVGRMRNGLGIYTYRFKVGGPTVMGVMADEVEQVMPHAVIKNALGSGFDAVNYGAL